MNLNLKKGFTLLEVLLVIAIIAILAGIVILAINPGKQIGQANDTQRSSDTNTILNAVWQYALDNGGAMPSTIGATDTAICLQGQTVACSTDLVDLQTALVAGNYLVSIPNDPSCSSGCDSSEIVAVDTASSGYTISQDATTNRITVTAPLQEQAGATISVSR